MMDDLKMQKQTLKKAYKKTKRKHITLWKDPDDPLRRSLWSFPMPFSPYWPQKFDNTMAARFRRQLLGAGERGHQRPVLTPVTSTPPRRWSTTVWL